MYRVCVPRVRCSLWLDKQCSYVVFFLPLDYGLGNLWLCVNQHIMYVSLVQSSRDVVLLTWCLLCHTILNFQANDDGSVLIVANSQAGQIFTVDPETGAAALIDLGGVLVHADGLVRF